MLKKVLCTAVLSLFAMAASAASVNVGVTQLPTDLNPLDPGDSMSTLVSELLYSPLVTLTDDLKYRPMLAEKVEREDADRYRVTLREGLKWSDGSDLTVDDVIFTLGFLTHKGVNSMNTQYMSVLKGTDEHGISLRDGAPEGVVKLDDRTLEFTCKEGLSFNMFNDLVARMILPVPQSVWGKFDPTDYKDRPEVQKPQVVSGPMKLKTFDRDRAVELVRNEGYFAGSPKIDGLNFLVMSGPELTVAFAADRIDMNVPMNGMVPSTDYEKLKSLKNITTFSGGPGTVQLLFLNNAHLVEPEVRQALSLAIDRKAIVDRVLLGQGEPTQSFFTSASPYRSADFAVPEYNPEKAKTMLRHAGFDFGKTLQFTVPTGNTTREQVAQVIQAQLAAIGVKVELIKLDFPTVMARAKEGDFDLLIMADTLVPLNPTYDLQFFITKGNYNGYFNQKIDDLVAAMMRQTDDEELKRQSAQLQQLLWDDMPMMSLYAAKDLYGVSKKMKHGRPADQGMFADLYLWEKED